jgi:hypothetical protein
MMRVSAVTHAHFGSEGSHKHMYIFTSTDGRVDQDHVTDGNWFFTVDQLYIYR